MRQGPDGITFHATGRNVATLAAAGAEFGWFAFNRMSTNSTDCIQAYPFNSKTGVVDYSALFDLAMSYDLRPSKHGGEGIAGISVTYQYPHITDLQKRTASWTVDSVNYTEYQFITPMYLGGEIVLAVNLGGSIGTGVFWGTGLNLTTPWLVIDGREWAWDPSVTS